MEKEKKKTVDYLSRFICTVYKPLYYVVLPIIFALILDLFTTVDFGINNTYVYWLIIILVVIIINAEYFICRALRKKKDSLREEQLTVGQKVKGLLIPFIVTLVLMIIIPFIHVMIMYSVVG